MKLIFVNSLGVNHKGEYTYEFIFGDNSIELEIWGEGWDEIPANSNPEPPDIKYISKVYELQTPKVDLELIQDSYVFSMYEAVDGIVALAWESYDTCPENKDRLYFRFGEPYDSVVDKLYARDLIFKQIVDYDKQ